MSNISERKKGVYARKALNVQTTNFTLYSSISFLLSEFSKSTSEDLEYYSSHRSNNTYNDYDYYDELYSSKYVDNIDPFLKGTIFEKENYPIYYEQIKSRKLINAPNVFNKLELSEFTRNYFIKYDVKSLLDVPVFINGELIGILCLESTKSKIKSTFSKPASLTDVIKFL